MDAIMGGRWISRWSGIPRGCPPARADGGVHPAKSRARARWRRCAQVAVTALALFILYSVTPLRDQVRWPDGRAAVIVEHIATIWTIQWNDTGEQTTVAIPADPAITLEPGVLSLLGRVAPAWVAAYFINSGLILAVFVARWRFLATTNGLSPPWRWSLCVWCRGQVIAALPTSQVGGDVYRIGMTSNWCGGMARATSVVLWERAFGFVGLVGLAVIGGVLLGAIPWTWTTFSVISLAATITVIGRVGRMLDASARVALLRRRLQRRDDAIDLLPESLRRPIGWILVILLALAGQALAALNFVMVDRALGLDSPVACYLVAIPAVCLAQFLPIHIAGIGILEGGLWVFLGPWAGRTPAEVVVVSAAARIFSLLWLGGLSFAFLFSADGVSPSLKNAGTNLQETDRNLPITDQTQCTPLMEVLP